MDPLMLPAPRLRISACRLHCQRTWPGLGSSVWHGWHTGTPQPPPPSSSFLFFLPLVGRFPACRQKNKQVFLLEHIVTYHFASSETEGNNQKSGDGRTGRWSFRGFMHPLFVDGVPWPQRMTPPARGLRHICRRTDGRRSRGRSRHRPRWPIRRVSIKYDGPPPPRAGTSSPPPVPSSSSALSTLLCVIVENGRRQDGKLASWPKAVLAATEIQVAPELKTGQPARHNRSSGLEPYGNSASPTLGTSRLRNCV